MARRALGTAQIRSGRRRWRRRRTGGRSGQGRRRAVAWGDRGVEGGGEREAALGVADSTGREGGSVRMISAD